jgi:hypothetical protein
MKTGGYITIEEISSQELADFLETGLCGSTQFAIEYEDNDYLELIAKGICCKKEYTTDICAKILTDNGTVRLIDIDCDGDSYSNLNKYINEDEEVEYSITIENVKRGIERALNGTYKVSSSEEKGNVMIAAKSIVEGDNYDYYDAYLVLQVILFDEIIYG